MQRKDKKLVAVPAAIALFFFFLLMPLVAGAQQPWYWIGYAKSGDWNDSADLWNLNPLGCYGTGGVPASGDLAYVYQGSSSATLATVTYGGGNYSASPLASLFIQNTNTGTSITGVGWILLDQQYGMMNANRVDIGPLGVYKLDTGTLTVSSSPSTVGTLGIAGNTTNTGSGDPYEGGIFYQKGGAVNTPVLSLGLTRQNTPGTGVYALLNGVLNVIYDGSAVSSGSMMVGNGGQGVFVQGQAPVIPTSGPMMTSSLAWTSGSGGTVETYNLYLGLGGGQGSYEFYNGNLTVTGTTYVGYSGAGSFTQSGGAHTANSVVIGTTGGYNLTGGTLNAAGIVNSGGFSFSGGNLNANLINNAGGVTTLSGGGVRTVNGDVTNNGVFRITTTTAVFTGAFTNNGALITDPSPLTFTGDLTIGSTGSIKASPGDTYRIAAGFFNNSTLPGSWSVGDATLEFAGPGTHEFLPGSNKGFAWGTLDIGAGATVTLEENGYILGLVFASGEGVGNILSAGSYTLYYDPSLNPGLDDMTYKLTGGGSLSPDSVPIPGAMWLFGPGLAGLLSIRRRSRKK